MDAGLLKWLGQTVGVVGVALGIVLLLFRDIIRKAIFPKLTRDHGYRLLQLISLLTWSVAVVGIGAWAWTEQKMPIVFKTPEGQVRSPNIATSGAQSPVIQNTTGDVKIDFKSETTEHK
jgi:hypothetical protein